MLRQQLGNYGELSGDLPLELKREHDFVAYFIFKGLNIKINMVIVSLVKYLIYRLSLNHCRLYSQQKKYRNDNQNCHNNKSDRYQIRPQRDTHPH